MKFPSDDFQHLRELRRCDCFAGGEYYTSLAIWNRNGASAALPGRVGYGDGFETVSGIH